MEERVCDVICISYKETTNVAAYSPSSNNQSNLPQSTVKYYDKKFRENLKAQTPFVAVSERLDLPMKSGNQYELNSYIPFF